MFSDDEIEANGMAILAIEKEIPKPVKKWKTEILAATSEYALTYVCPSCGEEHSTKTSIADTIIYYKKLKPLHCVNCGQALDWSPYEPYKEGENNALDNTN